MEPCLIAFDTGGTKTDAVLFTPQGTVLRRVFLPGANPLDRGFEAACALYLQAVETLTAGLQAPVLSLYGAVACNEYFEGRVARYLAARLPIPHIAIENDGACIITGTLGPGDGACLICGTGSALITRKAGVCAHIGGWGYLIDSCGSGFVLGKKALLAAAREADGRGEKTLLTALLAQRLGTGLPGAMEKIYQGGRPAIAALAGLVFVARRQGDAVAERIFAEGAQDLAELVRTAAQRWQGPLPLVLSGGIFAHYPEYAQAIIPLAGPDVQPTVAQTPPVYGCALEALLRAGLQPAPAFRDVFAAGCEKAKG